MTFQVRRSLLSSTDLFDVEVAAFAHELRNWRAHMARVEEDRKNGVQGIERHDPHPAPTAHPLVMAAVNDETAEPDYEYLDDRPTAADLLASRKSELFKLIAQVQQNATDAVISPAKLRLAQLRASDVAMADNERRQGVVGKYVGLLQKMKIKQVDYPAIEAEVSELRGEDDTRFLSNYAEKMQRIDQIQRAALQAISDVEDLTIETIDSYQLPKF